MKRIKAAVYPSVIIFILIIAQSGKAQDRVSIPGKYSGYSAPIYKKALIASTYVTMRDGVRIAVDYHIPKGLPPSVKLPTILIQTRYWRNMVVNLADDNTGKYLVRRGYAVVSVDVRGTGASFGVWRYPWAEDEIRDGAEIVDWIIKQPWSNGLVGTYGTSYMGSTAEFLLVNKHPAVKAAFIRYALYDAYTDIAFPGGIRHEWFLNTWNKANRALDANDLGAMAQLMGILPFHIPGLHGVTPVGLPHRKRSTLKAAVREHVNNGNVHQAGLEIEYRDDYSQSWNGAISQISPFYYKKDIEASGAAIYICSGWLDGSYTAAAVNRYLNLSNPRKLILGPWPHEGKENISPFSSTRKHDFSHQAELTRFFDYHLKGIDNGIMSEPPIYYYTMGEEAWKSAQTWPPPSVTQTFFFSGGHKLASQQPANEDGYDVYKVDYSVGSGHSSRYDSLLNLRGVHIGYPDRAEADKKLLVYETPPLLNDIEVTGHPIVRLYVSSTAADGQFFVYLEDVGPDGKVSYITEGLLRAAFREVSGKEPPYRLAPGVPYHTFLRGDAKPLIPGEIALITFDLQPISVLFKKGHHIRVAIAGADRDHFAPPNGDEPELKFYRSSRFPSSISLPVIAR